MYYGRISSQQKNPKHNEKYKALCLQVTINSVLCSLSFVFSSDFQQKMKKKKKKKKKKKTT